MLVPQGGIIAPIYTWSLRKVSRDKSDEGTSLLLTTGQIKAAPSIFASSTPIALFERAEMGGGNEAWNPSRN